MPSVTAIDWDRREARVVVGALQGRTLRVDDVFAVPWNVEGFDVAATESRGEVLKAELRQRGLGRGDAYVTIARGFVELKQLELPPAPDEELPDLVRFLARRELHTFDEDAPLDFIAVPAEAGAPRTVLAAAVDAKLIEHIRATCEAAGLRLRRVVLRPCATASMALRDLPVEGRPLRLTVDLGGDEAEVVATAGREVVLLRAARLPNQTDAAEYTRGLNSELRRTLAAVQYQAQGRRVEMVTLCGTRSDLTQTAAALATELELPVEIVDPGERLTESGSTVVVPSELRGRLGPLVGTLADEAAGLPPAFDFLHPRRRPNPPNRRKQMLTLGAIAAAVVLVGWMVVSRQLGRLDEEILSLRNQSTALNPVVKEADALDKRAAEIEKWLRSDVLWIDELARLAKQMPPADDAMLTQFRASAHSLGGEMQLTGVLAESSVGDDMENALRDATHAVEGRGRRYDPATKQYPWLFQSTIVVKNGDAPPAAKQGAR